MLHRHAGPAVAGSYWAGAVLGALTTGSALFVLSGLLSPIPAAARATAAVLALAILTLHVVRFVCLDLPQRAYQIPRETFTASPPAAAFRFAFELGTGVRTYITAAAPYAVAIVVALALPAGLGSAAFAVGLSAIGYGTGRSLVVAVQSMRSSIAVEHPPQWLHAVDVLTVLLALALAITAAVNA